MAASVRSKHRTPALVIVIPLSVLACGFLILVLISSYVPATSQVRLIDFVHPFFSIPAVLFVITAYLLKRGKRERFLAHYVAGGMGVSLSIIAALVGLDVVGGSKGNVNFLSTLPLHLLVAFLTLAVVLFQGAYGMSMVVLRRTAKRVRIHRNMAKWVLIVYLIQGSLGLTVLSALLAKLV